MRLFSLLPSKRHLSGEAYIAYYQRLPESIEVRWFRDGEYIVGKVSDGKKKFVTQGKDADNFIEMVNDALITTYDIPSDYVDAIKKEKAFLPSQSERRRLENLNIKKSRFGSKKRSEKALQLA